MGGLAPREEAISQAADFAHSELSRDEAWRERLEAVLEALGEASVADQAFLFQNRRGDDGRLWMKGRAGWSADEEPGSDGAEALRRSYPYFPQYVRWLDLLGSGGVVSGSVADLPDPETEALSGCGVVSTAIVPVFVGDQWWGFVGLDDRHSDRDWAPELDALRRVASAIATAIESERRREDRRLLEDPWELLVRDGPVIMYVDAVDEMASTRFISPQVEHLLGYSCSEWTDEPELWVRILHPDDRARAVAENQRHNTTFEPFRLEYRMFAKDGSVVWVRDEARMIRDEWDLPRYSIGVMMDVTDRMGEEERAVNSSYQDDLTHLPSQPMFDELLALSLQRAERHQGAVAVVVVDVDDFRLVNDSLGHSVGDDVLKLVGERLREAARETDLVARRGADQFLLLLADLSGESGELSAGMIRVESVAQRVKESMAAPFMVADTELYLSVSIGISVYPHDAQDAGALVRNAESAMYQAKKGGSGTGYVISSRGAFDSTAKLQFVTRLRKAVEAQRWTLHYQPVIDLSSGNMTGVEALIRWIEPDGTMVPPNEFIPLAEELGLIEHIGDWVVRELVYQVSAWRELDIDLEVGFNLSPRQFWQPDLADRILKQIRAGGIDPTRVIVEITESSAMLDPDRAQGILWELRAGGLAIAIDDFGTGYSSLSRLRDMPVRVLKIDRAFVSGVDQDPQAASIVSAFLELARGLGMTTLAEGIETEGELTFLREHGCELGQGFLFSKPVPPEEIIAFAFGGVPMPGSLVG